MSAPAHLTPRGGLEHPVFRGAGPGDQLLAALAFEPKLTDAQLETAQAILDKWSHDAARAEAEEPCHCDEPFLGERTLRLRVHNLVEPLAALRELVQALGGALPVREGHFSRWRAFEDREDPAAVLDPDAPEERTQFPAHEDYLRAVFDPASMPPASEYESQGKGAFETRTGDIVLEDRGVPLHLPPLRIGYGTARARFTTADARTGLVRDALAEALQPFSELAATRPPRFFEHTGGFDRVDRLEVAGRVGYGFAFASPELIQRVSVNRFRFREAEIFEALVGVIGRLELAPIVTWQRFGKPFAKSWRQEEMHVFQLWER
ncbi:MAG: hypothetical protein JST54_33315 [Deltaproteobacteria bacterium]|nr:hypothetical protein [Deltaproteobacteria bacterium]